MGDAMKLVETAPHEFDANLIINDIKPYFATDSAVKNGGGKVESSFEHDGERFVTKLYYDDSSNIVHPGPTLPTGRRFAMDTIREFRLKVEKSGDETGQKSFVAHIAPRWDGMKGEKSDGTTVKIPVPDGIKEGVNIRIQGSNIEFEHYHELVKSGFASVGVRGSYFDEVHKSSNITDAARYVRLDKTESGPVHGRDGPIAALGHLLESDRTGYRKVVQNDADEKGRNVAGYYHTVTLGQKRIREAFPSHEFPKEIKHYYAREAATKPKSQPLAHPKVEISYQRSRWDDKIGFEETDQLNRELNQTLYSVLADAGIQVHQGHSGPYVDDAYFDAENRDLPDEENPIIDLDLTRIKSEQENVVVKHLAGGLSPVQEEITDMLVTDGGKVSPADIAEEKGRHVGSVRRALRQMSELVETKYNDVALKSPHVAEMLHQAINDAKSAVATAVDTAAKAAEAAERGMSEHSGVSALMAWASNHGLDIRESDDNLKVDFGVVEPGEEQTAMEKIRKYLRDGKRAWVAAGRDPQKWDCGSWRATTVYTTGAAQTHYGSETTYAGNRERQSTEGGIGGTI
jgi:hypothetical protein